MKLMPVVLLLLLFSSVCSGMADCICKEPIKPELPSSRADAKEMEKAGKEVDHYNKGMRTYRDCVLSCLNRADTDLSGVVGGWNYAVDQYNAAKKEKERTN